ncbi:MAG: DsrE family protein [bacterium]
MINVQRKLVLAAIAVTLGIAGSVSYAFDQSSVDNMEQVVISIKTNPLKDPEPACVALQIGINLLMDLNGTVLPADKVILFPTIDGVELINPDNQINKRKKPKLDCDTPAGESTASLSQLLETFVELDGEVVICPLCANSRGITDPTQGKMGTAEDIHNLFLYADKVIDF